ncbi:hypothetical protein IF1G_00204 [Cordyceps javanica]|uniref:Uncharacterized protein n=1 Tax=Cordyceps javanica TaxID=43265 RepID=A0A545VEX1_9HYPO|nr:hypothetical protein IF1G_00204 [Cordyceps javanica]
MGPRPRAQVQRRNTNSSGTPAAQGTRAMRPPMGDGCILTFASAADTRQCKELPSLFGSDRPIRYRATKPKTANEAAFRASKRSSSTYLLIGRPPCIFGKRLPPASWLNRAQIWAYIRRHYGGREGSLCMIPLLLANIGRAEHYPYRNVQAYLASTLSVERRRI